MIQLTKDLVMVADDHCYTVGNPREGRGGAVEVRNPTYYTTAAQAVQGALNRAMRSAVKDGSITTLQEFIQEQDRQRAELEKLITPLDGGGNRGETVVETREAAGEGNYTPEDKGTEREGCT